MDKELERMERYQQLSDILQRLYGSPESGEALYKIFQSFGLSEEQYPIFTEIVGDTILGYFRLSEIPRLLQQRMQFSADHSQRATSKLIDFLAPIVRREEEQQKELQEHYKDLAQKFAEVKQEQQSSDTEQVEPLRTMESDMNRVHGYGAYYEQDAAATQDKKEEQA